MGRIYFAIALISVLALTGCARLGAGSPGLQFGPDATASSVSTADAISATNILAFINPTAAAKLSKKEQAEAASAQYYALQFGRPGAPRSWQGDTGASGRVSVGPYVRVNTLDCREFSHSVTIGGVAYERNGTACREADGSWDVVDA